MTAINSDFFESDPPKQKSLVDYSKYGDLLDLFRQARGELHGFANHLERSKAGLTADQIRFVLLLAETSSVLKTDVSA